MANTIGGEKKQAGNSAPATSRDCETNQKPGRFSNRKHEANVGTLAGAGRTTDAAKAVHGQFANPGEANNDGRKARASNQPHTDPNVGGWPQRPAVKK